MRKRTRLYALLGVLLVVCAAAFAVSRYEEQKEQIRDSCRDRPARRATRARPAQRALRAKTARPARRLPPR